MSEFGRFVGEEDEKGRISINKKLYFFYMGVILLQGASAVDQKFFEPSDEQVPSVVRHVDEVDSQTFDELDVGKGTLIYNEAEDTYVVYVEDNDDNPGVDAGWYEFDPNIPVAETEEQVTFRLVAGRSFQVAQISHRCRHLARQASYCASNQCGDL